MSGFEHLRKPKHPLAYRMVERIFSILATLGLACLCIGLILFISGRASDNLTVAQIGAYVLVIGIMLTGSTLLYWIAVKIAEGG